MKERNWEQFSEWVNDYERERLKDKTPLQRIEIFEALYQAALTLHKDKVQWAWKSDEDAKKSGHLKPLIEIRKQFMFAEKRRD